MKKFIILLILLPVIAMAQTAGGGQTPPGGGGSTPPSGGGSTPPSGGGSTPPGGGGSTQPVDIKITLKNPFKVGNDLYSVLEGIVKNVIMPIGGILCVLAFIYAGFLYVTAGGKEAQITKAHNALLFAAIGTAVLLGAWTIALVVRTTIEQVIQI